ncbi:Wzz/FepE/Etk N-terminal domain-containing protein [Clostridium sp. AN503]|uniref:YveK family protein n=1 Tax=Clostridium sp. AN503 TaxID=3160598 RepID=UPI00345A2C3B
MKNTTMANTNIKDDNIRNAAYENDEIEIDLLELLSAFRRRFWMILLALVIGGGLAGAFSYFVLTPQYTSTAMVYILSKETTLTSLADLQIGSQLTKDYKIIVTSRPVLEDVAQDLGLGLTYKELKEKIKIDNPSDTRILSITAEDPDPFLAKQIADNVARTSSEYIGDIMEMVPPKLIEDGQIPVEKTSPSNTRNALLGALAAVVLVCGVITIEVIMNDTVRSEEDVTKYLGLTVLASVPAREGEVAEDKEAMAKNKPVKPAARSRKKRKGN